MAAGCLLWVLCYLTDRQQPPDRLSAVRRQVRRPIDRGGRTNLPLSPSLLERLLNVEGTDASLMHIMHPCRWPSPTARTAGTGSTTSSGTSASHCSSGSGTRSRQDSLKTTLLIHLSTPRFKRGVRENPDGRPLNEPEPSLPVPGREHGARGSSPRVAALRSVAIPIAAC